MVRLGMTVRIKPDLVEEYTRLHSAVWPEVEATLRDLGFRRISIFSSGSILFMYQEYDGLQPIQKAYEQYAANPACRRWEQLMGRFQEEGHGSLPGIRWSAMEPVYHLG